MAQIEINLTKEEKINILNKNIKEFYDIDKKIKELQKVQKQTREEIMDLLRDKDTCESGDYDNGEFHAFIYKGTNSSLKANLIEENLKVTVTDKCYNVTTYDALKVEKSKKTKQTEDNNAEVKFNVEL